jgi:hypothetical protein
MNNDSKFKKFLGKIGKLFAELFKKLKNVDNRVNKQFLGKVASIDKRMTKVALCKK